METISFKTLLSQSAVLVNTTRFPSVACNPTSAFAPVKGFSSFKTLPTLDKFHKSVLVGLNVLGLFVSTRCASTYQLPNKVLGIFSTETPA